MAGAEDRRAEIANAICGTSKLTGKRGLIVGEDVKATEEQLALASLYADIGGARIRLVDEISFEQGGKKHTANGYYEDGVITIALKSDSFMGTMNHEMIHYIRKANPAGYDAMRELVFKIANKSGVDMEKHWANYEEEYGEVYGEDTQMTDIMEEMVADGFQKIVSNRKDLGVFLNELHKRDKTLVERLTEFLEKVGKTIKALFEDNTYHAFAEDLSRDLENIKQLRKKFAEVLADTGRMEVGTVKQGADVRFSIREIVGKKTDYGIGVVLDTNIFDGVKTRDWNKVLRDYVYKNMAGREIVMYDDNGNPEPVYFAKKNDRVKKGDTGNEHKVIDKLARYRGDNLRALATVHLDEALAASIENGGNKENSHQWMDEKGWIFRKVYLLDRNENIYEATLNIADGRDRKILYDINNIRKID